LFVDIQIPLLFLSAEDDPVVNLESMPITVPDVNPNVIVVLTKRGGHLGFLEGWWPTGQNWSDRVLSHFLSACADMNLPLTSTLNSNS
jgi:abhydrolase domain-containing protein 1/3